MIHFGVAGIPKSTPKPGYIEGLKHVANIGLDAFELEFVHFVNMSEETAQVFHDTLDEIKKESGKQIALSVHAPYYVNLNAHDDKKIGESIERILKSTERGGMAGAMNIVFHPGFYLKSSPEEAYKKVLASMRILVKKYQQEIMPNGITVTFRPETTGKPIQFGSVSELIQLSNEFENVLPCIDFAHLHARSNGDMNSTEEIYTILDQLKNGLGDRGIKQLHIHYSGIEYSEKGERRHLSFKDSDANYAQVLKALIDYDAEGILICESPEHETDALLLQETYKHLLR